MENRLAIHFSQTDKFHLIVIECYCLLFSPVQQWFQCLSDATDACYAVDNPMISNIRQMLSISKVAFNYVCEQEVDGK
jgi:hypothetical protein